MPNGRSVFPEPDLPPHLQSWGRKAEGDVVRNMDDIDSLKTNTIADYKQLNAATTAASNQLRSVRNFLYSIPSTNVQSISVSNISLAANTWTDIINITVPIPPARNKVTLLASLNVGLEHASMLPSVWYYLYSGDNPPIESPVSYATYTANDGSLISNKFIANAAGSSSYIYPNRAGGNATLRARLWANQAITFGGNFTLSYNLISGGPL